MQFRDETVVVGAGAVGLAIAVRLARAGIQVVVLDPLPPGGRASFGNAGIISPATVMPMSGPGVLRKVPGWMSDPLGPLFVSPRHFPRALPWLLRYIMAGRPARVRGIAAAMHYLHRDCIADWEYLLGAEFMARNMRFHGGLQLWSGPGNAKAAALGAEIRKRYGIEAEALSGDRLRELVPDVTPAMKTGLLVRGGGYTLDPAEISANLVAEFTRLGGRIVQRSVERIEREAPGRISLATNLHSIQCRRVVVAAGIWSGRLVAPLGIRIPLEAERGYHATLPNHNVRLEHSIGFKDRGFSVTPMRQGLRVAGTVEFSGLDTPPDMRRAQRLVKHAAELFPGIKHDEPLLWSGFRPSLPDSLPVIGPATAEGDVVMAFGHSHYGMSGAPGTARIVDDILHGRHREEHAMFNHHRF
jgi:glycine/D-amino acid oxidase-like deaminating enzyme